MSRLISLVILISAFAVTASASTITYQNLGTLGTPSATTSGSATAGSTYTVGSSLTNINGGSATGFVTVTTGTLVSIPCAAGTLGTNPTCFTFVGGSINISNGTMPFSDTFATGTLVKTHLNGVPTIFINATDDGATTQLEVDGSVSGTTTVVVAPEPGTLGLLGTGLIGLGGIVGGRARRRRE